MSASGKMYFAVQELYDNGYPTQEIIEQISFDYAVSEDYIRQVLDVIESEALYSNPY